MQTHNLGYWVRQPSPWARNWTHTVMDEFGNLVAVEYPYYFAPVELS
jgi:hypothetical protein